MPTEHEMRRPQPRRGAPGPGRADGAIGFDGRFCCCPHEGGHMQHSPSLVPRITAGMTDSGTCVTDSGTSVTDSDMRLSHTGTCVTDGDTRGYGPLYVGSCEYHHM
jgi:hypothetical protein